MSRSSFVATTALVVALVSACGGGKEPVGPDVTGMNLPDAKAALKKAGVSTTVHPTDTLLGVLVEENFVVCKEHAVSAHMVRLDVAKHGC